jgi:hypothetical protein
MLQNKINQLAEKEAKEKTYHSSESLRNRIEKWAFDNYGWRGFGHESNKLLEDFLSSVCRNATEWEKAKIEDGLLKG